MSNVCGRATAMTVLTPVRPGLLGITKLGFILPRKVPWMTKALRKLSFIHFARWSFIERVPDNGPPQRPERPRYAYLYFESKAAVFDSILDQAMADLRARLHRIEVADPKAPPPQVQLRDQVVATLEYIVNDRPLATLLLSAGHTPDVDASERLEMFFTEVRDLLRRALETGMEIGLVRPCQPELVAAAMLGMTRGVIELLVRQTGTSAVDEVVSEMLQVALRGVLA